MSKVSAGAGSPVKSVQRVSSLMNGNSAKNVTISAVDVSKSAVTFCGVHSNTQSPTIYGMGRAHLSNSTTVYLDNSAFNSATVYAEVIEYV